MVGPNMLAQLFRYGKIAHHGAFYLQGWNSVDEAEHRSASVDDCMYLCLEVLRPDFYLTGWFNTKCGIVSRKLANLILSDLRMNVRRLAICGGNR